MITQFFDYRQLITSTTNFIFRQQTKCVYQAKIPLKKEKHSSFKVTGKCEFKWLSDNEIGWKIEDLGGPFKLARKLKIEA